MHIGTKHRFPFLVLLVLLCALTVTACSDTPADSGDATLSSVPSLTPSPTASLTPTATPSPTATPTPTPTIAPAMDEKLSFYEEISEGHSLPIVSVYTAERAEILSRDIYVTCVVDLINCDDAYALDELPAGIKVRGNSSAHFGDEDAIRENTVPYRIKFDEKQSVLGLNNGAECRSWVLLKTEWDLIRNDIAFRMGRTILREGAFCSDSHFVFLYINEEFQGIYLLCEQCQVHDERVNISEVPADYTGCDIGYYLEIDNYAGSETDGHYFTQNYAYGSATDLEGVTRDFVSADYSIKSDIYSDEQVAFIEKYMNALFTVLYDACTNGNYYGLDDEGNRIACDYDSAQEVADALLDLDSVVDMYILFEIIHDYDCGEGSFYMCIDFSEDSTCPKLRFTSPWDFNWAYYDDAAGRYYAGAFSAREFVDQFGDRSNPWFILLMTQDWFVDMVRERWTELQSTGALEACFTAEEALLEMYWDDLNFIEEWATYCSQDLLTWIRTRVDWLDSQWLQQ